MMVKSKIKYIQSLSQKKQRDEDGVFIAEGPKIINELLSAPNVEPVELFGLKEWLQNYTGIDRSKITEVDEISLQKISFLSSPNQVLGLFKKPVFAKDLSLNLSGKITLMADNIQDPGNMGSIIRCADWFGISTVICSNDCADVFSPKTIQSTMGSISRVEIVYGDLEFILNENRTLTVFAATLNGSDLNHLKPVDEGIILVGNESKGISKNLLQLSHQQITIPRKGHAESLNAAVATGIILSHFTRSTP